MKTTCRFLALLAITAISMGACTNLEEEVFSEIPIDKFFQTEEDVLMNAGRAYTKLERFLEEQRLVANRKLIGRSGHSRPRRWFVVGAGPLG